MNWTSDQWLKSSLGVLHVILFLLAWAALTGRNSQIIADMYSTTCWAIILNLAAISGNKALQKAVDKWPGPTLKSTIVTTETRSDPNP